MNPLTRGAAGITVVPRAKNNEQLPLDCVIKAVLFDIDGTLVRTGGAGMRAFERTSAALFGIPNGTGHLRFAGRTDTGLIREFFQHHGIQDTAENLDRFLHAYVHLLDHLLAGSASELCPGVTRWLRDLKKVKQSPLVGLLTGNIRLGAEIKLRHFGLWDAFAVGAFGCDHSDRNKLAEIALRRCSQLLGGPLQGGEILVIGDTPLDIECARAIGAPCLAVATGDFGVEQLMRHQPTWAVETLEALDPEICLKGPSGRLKPPPPGRKTRSSSSPKKSRTPS